MQHGKVAFQMAYGDLVKALIRMDETMSLHPTEKIIEVFVIVILPTLLEIFKKEGKDNQTVEYA